MVYDVYLTSGQVIRLDLPDDIDAVLRHGRAYNVTLKLDRPTGKKAYVRAQHVIAWVEP